MKHLPQQRSQYRLKRCPSARKTSSRQGLPTKTDTQLPTGRRCVILAFHYTRGKSLHQDNRTAQRGLGITRFGRRRPRNTGYTRSSRTRSSTRSCITKHTRSSCPRNRKGRSRAWNRACWTQCWWHQEQAQRPQEQPERP